MKYLTTVPTCFYHPSIIKAVDAALEYDPDTDFSGLDKIEQDKLTVLCMDVLDEDCYTCITESDNYMKIMDNIKNYILSGKMDEGYELLNCLRENCVKYFAPVLEQLFIERQPVPEHYDQDEDHYYRNIANYSYTTKETLSPL